MFQPFLIQGIKQFSDRKEGKIAPIPTQQKAPAGAGAHHHHQKLGLRHDRPDLWGFPLCFEVSQHCTIG